MASYDYSKIAKEIRKEVEGSIREEISNIDLANIISEIMAEYNIDLGTIDIKSDNFKLLLTKTIQRVVKGSIDDMPKIEIDLDDFIDLDEQALNKKVAEFYDAMEDAFDRGDEKAAKGIEDNFVKAISTGLAKGYRIAADMMDEYNAKLSERMGDLGKEFKDKMADGTDVDYTSKARGDLTTRARQLQKLSLDVQKQVKFMHSQTDKLKNEVQEQTESVISLQNLFNQWQNQNVTKTNERYTAVNSKTLNTYGLPDVAKEAGVTRDMIMDVIKQSKENVDTFLHTHPEKYAAFSDNDVKAFFELYRQGITKQIVTSYEEAMTLDMSKVDIGKEDSIVRQIKEKFDEIETEAVNNLPIGNFADKLKSRAGEILNGSQVQNLLPDILTKFKNSYSEMLNSLGSDFTANDWFDKYEEAITTSLQGMSLPQDIFKNQKLQLIKLSQELLQDVNVYLRNMQQKLFQNELINIFSNPDYLKDGFSTAINVESLESFVSGLTVDKFSDKINAIGKEVGASFIEGFRQGIDAHSDSKETASAADDAVNGIIHEVENRLPEIENAGKSMGEALVTGLEKELQDAKDRIEGYENQIASLSAELNHMYETTISEGVYDYETDRLQRQIETIRGQLSIEREKTSELERQKELLDQQQKTKSDGVFDSSNTTALVDSLEKISSLLEDIRNTLGTIDDNSGFKNLITSIDELMTKLQAIQEKVGTGVYNISVTQGTSKEAVAATQSTDAYIKSREASYRSAYEKVVARAGDEEKLFAAINNAVGLVGGISELQSAFSALSVTQIQSAEERIQRYIRFFDLLRQAMSKQALQGFSRDENNKITQAEWVKAFDIDLSGIRIPSGNDSAFRAGLKKRSVSSKTESEMPQLEDDSQLLKEIVSELESIRNILNDIVNNNALGEAFSNAAINLDGFTNAVANLKEILDGLNVNIENPVLNAIQQTTQAETQMGEEGQLATDKIKEGMQEAQPVLNETIDKFEMLIEFIKQFREATTDLTSLHALSEAGFLANLSTGDFTKAFQDATLGNDGIATELYQNVINQYGKVFDTLVHTHMATKAAFSPQDLLTGYKDAFKQLVVFAQDEISWFDMDKLRAQLEQAGISIEDFVRTFENIKLPSLLEQIFPDNHYDGSSAEFQNTVKQALVDTLNSFNYYGINADEIYKTDSFENFIKSVVQGNMQILQSARESIDALKQQVAIVDSASTSSDEVQIEEKLTEELELQKQKTAEIQEQNNLLQAQNDLLREQSQISIVGEENNSLDVLREKLNGIIEAINVKSQAFIDEGNTVDEVVQREVASLEQLRSVLNNIATVSDTDETSKESNAFSGVRTVIEEIQEAIGVKNNLLAEEFSLVAKEVPNEIELFKSLSEILDTIAQRIITVMNGVQTISKSKIVSDANKEAQKAEATAKKQQDKEAAQEKRRQEKEAAKQQKEAEKLLKQLEQEEQSEIDKDSRKVVQYYAKLEKNEKQYQQLVAKRNAGIDLTSSEAATLRTLRNQREEEQGILDVLKERTDEIEQARKGYEAIVLKERQSAELAVRESLQNDITKRINAIRTKADSGKYTALSSSLARQRINNIQQNDYVNETDVKTLTDYVDLLNQTDKSFVKIGNNTKLVKLLNDVSTTIAHNSKMSGELRSNFDALGMTLQRAIDTGASQEEVQALTRRFLALKNEMTATGQEGKSFADMIKNDIGQASARMIAQYMSFQDWIRYIRNAVGAVTELDSALNQLKIISNSTDAALQGVATGAYELANSLGMTTTEVVSSITEWKRLGYSMEDSMILAEQAARLSTGGMMDINAATTSLISSMQAFEIGADEVGKVVDQYIYLGKFMPMTNYIG